MRGAREGPWDSPCTKLLPPYVDALHWGWLRLAPSPTRPQSAGRATRQPTCLRDAQLRRAITEQLQKTSIHAPPLPRAGAACTWLQSFEQHSRQFQRFAVHPCDAQVGAKGGACTSDGQVPCDCATERQGSCMCYQLFRHALHSPVPWYRALQMLWPGYWPALRHLADVPR